MVCGQCSKNKFLIPNQSAKPVRVCNACYDKLGKSRTSLKENLDDSQTGVKTTNEIQKSIQINESSESEDETQHKNTDDDLTRSLEDLTIDENEKVFEVPIDSIFN